MIIKVCLEFRENIVVFFPHRSVCFVFLISPITTIVHGNRHEVDDVKLRLDSWT